MMPTINTHRHPCYDCGAAGSARIHLPVAPKCNIQCNYCLRKYDCLNESRPGVVSGVLTPEQAASRFRQAKSKIPELTVVGIAGPGDALANYEHTYETLERIRAIDRNIMFCLSTNGLMLPRYVHDLSELGVSHITITINALDSDTGSRIYKWVDYGDERHTGIDGAAILLENQLEGLSKAAELGIVIKVNTVAVKDINTQQIPQIAQKLKDCGVYIHNIMPHIPVENTVFGNLQTIDADTLGAIRDECSVYVKQMHHCRHCRADAVGTLDNDRISEFRSDSNDFGVSTRFAVASDDGHVVNRHFGHADKFYIYDSDGESVRFAEIRDTSKYCGGSGTGQGERDRIFELFADCDGILTSMIGPTPQKKLLTAGKSVITTYDYIEPAVKNAARTLIANLQTV